MIYRSLNTRGCRRFPLAFSVISEHVLQTSFVGYAPGLRSMVGLQFDDGYFGGIIVE